MKAYVLTTGIVFGLLASAHVVRFLQEGPGVTGDPWFVSFTILAVALGLWALRLLLTARGQKPQGGPRNEAGRKQ